MILWTKTNLLHGNILDMFEALNKFGNYKSMSFS